MLGGALFEGLFDGLFDGAAWQAVRSGVVFACLGLGLGFTVLFILRLRGLHALMRERFGAQLRRGDDGSFRMGPLGPRVPPGFQPHPYAELGFGPFSAIYCDMTREFPKNFADDPVWAAAKARVDVCWQVVGGAVFVGMILGAAR